MQYISSDTNAFISKEEYLYCLTEFQKENGKKVRLPADELQKRIDANR